MNSISVHTALRRYLKCTSEYPMGANSFWAYTCPASGCGMTKPQGWPYQDMLRAMALAPQQSVTAILASWTGLEFAVNALSVIRACGLAAPLGKAPTSARRASSADGPPQTNSRSSASTRSPPDTPPAHYPRPERRGRTHAHGTRPSQGAKLQTSKTHLYARP